MITWKEEALKVVRNGRISERMVRRTYTGTMGDWLIVITVSARTGVYHGLDIWYGKNYILSSSLRPDVPVSRVQEMATAVVLAHEAIREVQR